MLPVIAYRKPSPYEIVQADEFAMREEEKNSRLVPFYEAPNDDRDVMVIGTPEGDIRAAYVPEINGVQYIVKAGVKQEIPMFVKAFLEQTFTENVEHCPPPVFGKDIGILTDSGFHKY
jgi:hypothetical protein